MKHTVVYRTQDVTLVDGAIEGYRFTAYHDTRNGIRITFLPYDEEVGSVVFEFKPEGGLVLENPKDLLEYVEFFGELL
jgi:hypothetical protein